VTNAENPLFPGGRERGRFYAPGTDADAEFVFRRIDHRNYQVTTQFDYVEESGVAYRVPSDVDDNTTDLASIPAIVTWLVPRDGRHTPAAVLHDALIGGRNGVDYIASDGENVTDRHADYLFREAMSGLGVAWLRKWMMWAAVALRTLVMKIDPNGKSKPNLIRLVPVVVLVLVWAVAFAVMALDVPDVSRISLPWLGDRPLIVEIGLGLAMVAIGSVLLAVLFGLTLQSIRGVAAGAIAGVAIGFLALPMVASAIGFTMYVALEWVFSTLFDNRRAEADEGPQYEIKVEPDPGPVSGT